MRFRSLGRACRGICFAWACHAGVAAAQSETEARPFAIALRYAAVGGCPGPKNFQAIVTKRLGYDPFSENVGARVFVFVAPVDATLEGHVVWHDSAGIWAGDQTFPSKTANCSELVVAMGFAVALQIQLLSVHKATDSGDPVAASPSPHLLARAVAPTPAPAPGTPSNSDEQRSAGQLVSRTRRSDDARSTATAFANAGVSVGFAMAADAIALGRVGGALTWPHLALELDGEASLPTITRRNDHGGFSQRYLLLSAAICGREQQWIACPLVKAGQVRIDGRDVDVLRSSSAAFVQAGVRAETRQIWSGFYLGARAEGLVNLTRWTGALDNVPVWSTPRFAFTLGLDLGVLLH